MFSANQATTQTFLSYLFFWSGQVLSLLGSTIVQFVIIWWIVVYYLNPIYLSIAYLLGIGVQVLFLPIAGVFVDRWNRKLVIGITDAVLAAGALGLIILFTIKDHFANGSFFWLIVVLLCFRGIASSFHDTATRAIIPLMVPRHHLNRLNGLNFLFLGFINIIGPAIGAVLYELFPLNIIIWIDCITFITAIIPLVLIAIPTIENSKTVKGVNGFKSFVHDLRDGINVIRTKEGLFPLIFVLAIFNFLQIPIIVLGPFFVYSTHSGQVQDLAFIIASSQLGFLFSGILMLIKKDWNRKAFIIILCLYLQLFGYFMQVITPIGVFEFMAVGAFIFGAMLPIINATFRTILQVVVPPELQGRVTAITTAMTGAILPIGMLASGPLAESLGIVELFLISIIMSFIMLSLMYIFTDLRYADKGIDASEFQQDILPASKVMGVGK
jgi:DHA3 family macrolide efflux protein-like MFS transporter